MIKKKKQKAKLAKFFDEEAELGSENEENDDRRRVINKGDKEENEEGMDEDLADFIVHGDEDVVGEEEEGMMSKFMADMENDDRMRTRMAMEATIFGIKNKKRQRKDVPGLDEAEPDEFEKRK